MSKKTIFITVFNTAGESIGQLEGEPVDILGIPCVVHKAVSPFNPRGSGWWVTSTQCGVSMMGRVRGAPTRASAIDAARANINFVGVEGTNMLIAAKLASRT